MRSIADSSVRIFVGVVFIFSGLIKVNDPIGTAIKLKEYFDVFSSDFASFFQYLVPVALILSVLFVVLEVVLGVALLIKYRMKITAWVLLLLIDLNGIAHAAHSDGFVFPVLGLNQTDPSSNTKNPWPGPARSTVRASCFWRSTTILRSSTGTTGTR